MSFLKMGFQFVVRFGLGGRLPDSAAPAPVFVHRGDTALAAHRIVAGCNAFMAWRENRGLSEDEAAKVMGVQRRRYRHFEMGEYRGLMEEHIQKFCDACGIHASVLAQPGAPLSEPLLRVLIADSTHKNRGIRRLAENALRMEIQRAFRAVQIQRDACINVWSDRMIAPFLDILEGRIPHARPGVVDPEETAAMYMEDVDEQIRVAHSRTHRPDFVHDDIWRTYWDAVLRLYGPNLNLGPNIENLRAPFRKYKWEWDMVCGMVMDNPEVLHPMLWGDDMGSQMVGGEIMSRDDAVRAMLDNYKANEDRNTAINIAHGTVSKLKAGLAGFRDWLKRPSTQDLFRYVRNREAAQAALGVEARGNVPIAGVLPPPAKMTGMKPA
ncbi:MAG: helix-turn-helix transcriptional regulator [Rhodospirillales bacterium]|nr:helix-turn-helix transcriptional regulator [Alphaproteobacteria bacterium]MCB9987235.1 helix-turn-helix transcriptional regulator [Rhodospirillales bacterium]USO07904.1 MAG: helix-turn-helix transcriptional regulator [Rhodospirillales bacterium]